MKNIKVLITEFQEGKYLNLLKDIYIDDNILEYQNNRYITALEKFKEIYGNKEVEIYSAPGRSEVCGNHTDHQYGKVLATSINLDTIAVVAKNDNNKVRLKSEGYSELVVNLNKLDFINEEKGTSNALIRGIASKLSQMNYSIGGFYAYVTSDVLGGSGMSSSAAFETLVGTIFSNLYNENSISAVEIACVGQYAENIYFGKPCGLMDQMACSVGGLVYIDFEKADEPKARSIDIDFSLYAHSLCIVDTKGSHADLTDEYAAVPDEMNKVANYFGKTVLREVDENEFLNDLSNIRQALDDRSVLRAIHYFNENKRVDTIVKALEDGEFDTFKSIIRQSGDSSYKYLQNVYSASKLKEQGVSIGLAVSDIFLGNQGVSRVHGGGFAGTIQAFVPDNMVSDYKQTIENVFGKGSCMVLKVRKYGGIKVV